MFSQDKKKIGVEKAEDQECQGSQLNQIYLEQWEKENLKQKIEKKKQMKRVRDPLEDKKCNENKGVRFKKKGKKITQEREDELVHFKKKDEKIKKEMDERSVEDLVAENNNLKDNLIWSTAEEYVENYYKSCEMNEIAKDLKRRIFRRFKMYYKDIFKLWA